MKHSHVDSLNDTVQRGVDGHVDAAKNPPMTGVPPIPPKPSPMPGANGTINGSKIG